MPVMDGIEAIRQIHAKMTGIKILALSMYSDKSHGMMSAGAVKEMIVATWGATKDHLKTSLVFSVGYL